LTEREALSENILLVILIGCAFGVVTSAIVERQVATQGGGL